MKRRVLERVVIVAEEEAAMEDVEAIVDIVHEIWMAWREMEEGEGVWQEQAK